MALPIPTITEADVHAVRCMIIGTATPDQQRRGMRLIGEQFCGIFNTPYVADGGDRETFIAIGRHQVGTMISHLQTVAALEAAQNHDKAVAARAAVTQRGKP